MVVHGIDSEAGNGEDEEEDDDDDCDGDVALDHFGWGQSEIVVDGEVVVRSIMYVRTMWAFGSLLVRPIKERKARQSEAEQSNTERSWYRWLCRAPSRGLV